MKKKDETRRERARVPYENDVVINNSLRVRAIDISEGGLYLHTGRSFPSGTMVEVSFPLFYDTLTVQAEVRFSHEGVGMGLMFRNLDAEQATLIRRFIDKALKEDETAGGAKKKILVIGDNEMTMKMYRSELTLAQFTVLQCGTPEEAVDMLKGQNVGVVLVALDMERAENFNALTFMKKSPLSKDIPVLVVSPANLLDTKKRVFEAGADVFMDKITAAPKKVAEEIQKLYEKATK